jgi:acetyl-CoA acetyltransferase
VAAEVDKQVRQMLKYRRKSRLRFLISRCRESMRELAIIGIFKEGDAEELLREGATSLGGRIPVCTDGGCTCLGECIPAQALSQTYEAVVQLRGDAGAMQVEGAKVGFSVNSGKLVNSSAIVYKR